MQCNRRQSFWSFILVTAVSHVALCGASEVTETPSTTAPTVQACVNMKSADFSRVEDAPAHAGNERVPLSAGESLDRPVTAVLGVPHQDHAIVARHLHAAGPAVAAEAGLPPAKIVYVFHCSFATFRIRS